MCKVSYDTTDLKLLAVGILHASLEELKGDPSPDLVAWWMEAHGDGFSLANCCELLELPLETVQTRGLKLIFSPSFLVNRRRASGLGRLKLAQRLGVQKSSVWEWEAGRRPLPKRLLLPLAKIFRELDSNC